MSAFKLFPNEPAPVSKAALEHEAAQADLAALTRTVEKHWIHRYVKRRVAAAQNTLDFVVKDDDGKIVGFKTRELAERFVLTLLRLEHPDMYPKDDEPLPPSHLV
jgi:hypothetical protein